MNGLSAMREQVKAIETDKIINGYCVLRGMFAKMVTLIEKSAAYESGYHGVQLTDKNAVSFSLLFFDRICVIARFTGMLSEDKKPFGQIAFEQEGKPCRTYYFNEQGQVFDEFGVLAAGSISSVAQVDDILTAVTHKLIDDGTAFETFDFFK
jgi:hypothetical protein